jgi:signal transduction histidine kinase
MDPVRIAVIVSVFIGIIAVLWLAIMLLLRKLRESENLKYEFITIIAHKFRTPLTQVKWSLEGLTKNETDPYKKQAMSDIGMANANLINLTNTLVELTDAAGAAKSSYKFERLDLCELVKSALDASKKQFHEKNLFMSMNCTIPEVFVKADRARLEYVISTLLENACSYTSPGRNISVSIGADKKKAAVSVADDGIGIDRLDMLRIFTKFFRSKAARTMDTEGMGVGLYLARGVMKRLGGSINAFSDGAGRGSTFSVVLKRVR